ncbi:MAG: malto-oligosyltrehalose synthase, partial [Acidimicrobiia bacterium]
GDPLHPAVTVAQLHQACQRRQERWPGTMTTLSTHDTKRSADVRARLTVLSEPALSPSWPELVDRWVPRLLERWPADVEPDAPTLLVCLQTLLGAWPISADRLEAYLVKAAREAKTRTTWTEVDEGFEAGLAALAGIVDDPVLSDELAADAEVLEAHGWWKSLVQTAIALLQPGVPDVYQGTETIDLSLVDPDNRRPVDHDVLAGELADVDEKHPTRPGPAAKLALTSTALRLRRERPELFGAGPTGAHRPLHAQGPDADRIVAFCRGDGVAVVTVRFPTRGPVVAGTTIELPPARWSPRFGGQPCAGGRVDLAELLGDLPVAVLEARS